MNIGHLKQCLQIFITHIISILSPPDTSAFLKGPDWEEEIFKAVLSTRRAETVEKSLSFRSVLKSSQLESPAFHQVKSQASAKVADDQQMGWIQPSLRTTSKAVPMRKGALIETLARSSGKAGSSRHLHALEFPPSSWTFPALSSSISVLAFA